MSDAVLTQYPLQNPDNPARVIDGETVIVTPDDSQLHTLNGTGTFIWQRCDGQHKLEAIVTAMVDEFEVERDRAEQDAVAFVQACVEKKVLRLSDGPIARDEDK